MIKNWLLIIVCFYILYIAFYESKGITHQPGLLVKNTPSQVNLAQKNKFDYKDHEITAKAEFILKARVLSRKNYYFGRETTFSPIDLALGWQNMSDQSVLDKIKITQRGRFYYWKVKDFPIPRKKIETQSANMHLIPKDSSILRQIKKVKKGSIIHLKGKLVDIQGKDGWKWRSSMTRNDTGNGACEIIWVEKFKIIKNS